MHAIEKILAKNSGRREVRTGEIVTAKVDFAEINDLYLQTVYSFYEMGGERCGTTRAALSFLTIMRPARISKALPITRRCGNLLRRTISNSTLIPIAACAIR